MAGLTEVVIEDLIDLDGVPPCSVFLQDLTARCGQPSVARIRLVCPEHGRTSPEFACAECLEQARLGWLLCTDCDSTLSNIRET